MNLCGIGVLGVGFVQSGCGSVSVKAVVAVVVLDEDCLYMERLWGCGRVDKWRSR